MKSRIIILIILLATTGCIKENPSIILKNNSNMAYDSVQVYVSSDLPTTFKELEIGEERRGKVFFDKKIQNDGTYMIRLFKEGEVINQRPFGYYTNGASLDSRFGLTIENDTLLVEYYKF